MNLLPGHPQAYPRKQESKLYLTLRLKSTEKTHYVKKFQLSLDTRHKFAIYVMHIIFEVRSQYSWTLF